MGRMKFLDTGTNFPNIVLAKARFQLFKREISEVSPKFVTEIRNPLQSKSPHR
jgi:hypothetical protein